MHRQILYLENVCLLCLLHYIQVHLRLDFFMEVNNMDPDQDAPKDWCGQEGYPTLQNKFYQRAMIQTEYQTILCWQYIHLISILICFI